MLRLRPFKPSDCEELLSWTRNWDEESFEKWSAGRFSYPLTKEQLKDYCRTWIEERKDGWPMAAVDEKGKLAGHFFMQAMDYETNQLYLGLIIVDDSIRGKGTGKEMISLALDYGFRVCRMDRAFLRVFENNPGAKRCYEAAGFCEKSYLKDHYRYKEEMWNAFEMEAFRKEQ